jgi:hypothetical protein
MTFGVIVTSACIQTVSWTIASHNAGSAATAATAGLLTTEPVSEQQQELDKSNTPFNNFNNFN